MKKFSKFIVTLSILLIVTYTAAVLWFVWQGLYVPDSLTYSFFGAFAVELSAVAGIKIKEKVTKQEFKGNDYFNDIL